MRTPLTDTQQGIYAYIVEFIRENGYSPAMREIQEHFDFQSANSVVIHLRNLQNKGYITKSSSKEKMRTRTIRLVDDIIGNYTIDSKFLHKSLKQLRERGYELSTEIAIEFLKDLKVNIV